MARVCKRRRHSVVAGAGLSGAAGAESGILWRPGECVRAMQGRLQNWGFSGDVDGIFGDETQTAVKNFQTANGMQTRARPMRNGGAHALGGCRFQRRVPQSLVEQAGKRKARLLRSRAMRGMWSYGCNAGWWSWDTPRERRPGAMAAPRRRAFPRSRRQWLSVTGVVNAATYDALFAVPPSLSNRQPPRMERTAGLCLSGRRAQRGDFAGFWRIRLLHAGKTAFSMKR